ncbi:MAG: transposase [Planctomycetota bacterium]|nr:transposase [Planctomycetota bacterium]
MSVAVFCRREGISPATFYRWRREAGHGRPSFAEVRVTDVLKVSVESAGASVSVAFPVEIVLVSGDRLRLSGQCAPAWLARVVAILRGRPC